MALNRFITPGIRSRVFRLLHPNARQGFPTPAGREIESNISGALGEIMRDFALDAEAFWKFKDECGYAAGYESYMGPDLLNQKLLEHFVSLELTKPKKGEVLIDVGSAESPFADYAAHEIGCESYSLDLTYPPGINGRKIGCSADQIPMEDQSVDVMTLHCTIDHFEGESDSGFVREVARILRPGGRVCVLPVYFTREPANLCGPTRFSPKVKFDPEARIHRVDEYYNRFGRFYSPQSFRERILNAAPDLKPSLFRVVGDQPKIPNNYLHYALLLEKC